MNATLISGLGVAGVLAAISVVTWLGDATAEPQSSAPDGPVARFEGRVFDESGRLVGPVSMPKVKRTDREWKAQLTKTQYRVVREQGTERPFTGALLENKVEGVYTCVACDLPLFGSKGKFRSGTGWPSFYEPIAAENVDEQTDRTHGMLRTEILCARCDGHLGHLFPDGPPPTGKRYCVNSESLGFTPAAEVRTLAEPIVNPTTSSTTETGPRATAVFAGGCFWCVEAVFEELDGVTEAVSGYAGGTAATAKYAEVCSGQTGHAEAVQIVYDPSKITYEDLLRVHFATHDPTQLNRQGNDVGPQYRSTVFFANAEERTLAEAMIEDLNDQKAFGKPVVTTLEPLTEFYAAERYHQNYVCNNPGQGYVQAVALPKVAKVRKKFKSMLKDTSPLEQSGR